MTVEQGIAFLQALRAKHIRDKGNGWIEASCVLAPWTHSHQQDVTPSFGLRAVPGERGYFKCFACREGSAEELLQTIELYAKSSLNPLEYDFPAAHQVLADETIAVTLPGYQEFKAQPVMEPWPEYWLESFQKAEWSVDAMVYLGNRDVSVQKAWDFDLRFDTKRQMVVAPYRDVHGRLAGARGRAIVAEAPFKHYDYTYQHVNNARFVWFGEPSLNLPGPVVVVEGQFDTMRVAQVWPKVVGALSSKPTWEKMRKLTYSPLLIQIPDRDEAGAQSMVRYKEMCKTLNIPYRHIWLDEGCKDPDECSPAYLYDRIQEVL